MTATTAGDLSADWTTVSTPDGPMRVYRAHPPASQAVNPAAAVIVLQEAFGVNDHIQDVTRRLAAQGYLAVAPDLFHRSGKETVEYTDFETAMGLIGELGPEQINADVAAVLAQLANDGIHADRTAIVGFCFGGRAAFTAATAFPVAATVVFYGPGIASGPHAVVDRADQIKGSVLMFVGDADPHVPEDDRLAIESAARKSGVDLRSVVVGGAGHAFHCDARPDAYVADAAQQAWRDTTGFLSETLSPQS
ncbi:dienelactone hydrolase family protein [Mycobacterium sp. pR1184]|uniref:dienelactone hydrolase family protein n=1 Tax=Mycobacterium sp. pR1184 TaxID=3238981 RepID=UPI00351B8688